MQGFDFWLGEVKKVPLGKIQGFDGDLVFQVLLENVLLLEKVLGRG